MKFNFILSSTTIKERGAKMALKNEYGTLRVASADGVLFCHSNSIWRAFHEKLYPEIKGADDEKYLKWLFRVNDEQLSQLRGKPAIATDKTAVVSAEDAVNAQMAIRALKTQGVDRNTIANRMLLSKKYPTSFIETELNREFPAVVLPF